MARRKWLIEQPFWFGLLVAVVSVLIGIPWGKTWEQQAMNLVLGFLAGVVCSLMILAGESLVKRLRRRRG